VLEPQVVLLEDQDTADAPHKHEAWWDPANDKGKSEYRLCTVSNVWDAQVPQGRGAPGPACGLENDVLEMLKMLMETYCSCRSSTW
jgi:hypothetical protein